MELAQLIGHQTGFSLRLAAAAAAAAAAKHGGGANVVLSPLPIHAVLSLVAAGAKGPTLDQLLSVLGHEGGAAADDLAALTSHIAGLVIADGSDDGGPKLSVANAAFVDSSLSLKPKFKEIATEKYKAEVKVVDFRTKATEVTNEVNSWVKNATSNLIEELLPPGSVNGLTRLVLCNALYFKGAWNEKFDSSATKEYDFHLLNGTSVKVPFMTTREEQCISTYDGFKVLRLPYKQGNDNKRQFSMYIFLPDAHDGLWSLEKKMSSEPDFLSRHIPNPWRKIDVRKFKLPKFKIMFGIEASSVLRDMGLLLPFSEKCNLSEMVDSPIHNNLYVSSVFHKSFIEVNEEGSEAAAATSVVFRLTAYIPPVDFEADHPFIFMIREDLTGAVLFIGHVIDPSLAE